MVTNMDRNESTDMTCPTCGAEQGWSDQCRRCRCDLTELNEAWRQWTRFKQRCLGCMSRGEFRAALRWARVCHQMIPCDASRRLVAASHLQLGDWPAAVAMASHALTRE